MQRNQRGRRNGTCICGGTTIRPLRTCSVFVCLDCGVGDYWANRRRIFIAFDEVSEVLATNIYNGRDISLPPEETKCQKQ